MQFILRDLNIVNWFRGAYSVIFPIFVLFYDVGLVYIRVCFEELNIWISCQAFQFTQQRDEGFRTS